MTLPPVLASRAAANLLSPDQEYGLVVILFSKRLRLFADRANDFEKRRLGFISEYGLDWFEPQLPTFEICSFRNAIAQERQHISRVERQSAGFKIGIRESRQRKVYDRVLHDSAIGAAVMQDGKVAGKSEA